MEKITENFIIEYEKQDENYVDELVNYLENNTKRILDFFELKQLKTKKKIIIWDDIEKYKKHIETTSSIKYLDYMIADTNDGNINMLSIYECQKTNEHKNITLDRFQKNIVHEFVHACHNEINPNDNGVIWFFEALATNLGNPYRYLHEIDCTKEELMYEFNNGLKNAYPIAYTLGKYMLEHYPHEKILDYVKNPHKLIQDIDIIINETKAWLFNETNLKTPNTQRIK